MTINELAREVHENAVRHGFYDDGIWLHKAVALIHSEWSEALQEERTGRPFAYIMVDTSTCPQIETHMTVIERDADGHYMLCGKEYHGKPEGVAVELIDGCLRILDYLGYGKVEATNPDTDTPLDIEDLIGRYTAANPDELPKDVPTLVSWLHACTSQTIFDAEEEVEVPELNLLAAMSIAMTWVRMQGIDPVALLIEKHTYNKSRPYKHNKKF